MPPHHSLSGAIRTCGWGFLVATFFSLALNVLMLTVPLYMMSVYDRVLTSRSGETLLMLTVIAVGALAVVGVLEAVRQLTLARTGARLEAELGAPVLEASLQSSRRSGPDIQGLRDLAHLRQFIASPVSSALFDVPMTPLYLALLYLIDPQFFWIALSAALLILLVAGINQLVTSRPLEEASRHGAAALHKAQAHARHAEVVHAMGMFRESVASWGSDNARAMDASDRAARLHAVSSSISQFLRLSLQVGILGFGAYLVLSDNSLSVGTIFAASMISARALAPLNHAIGSWRAVVSARQAWNRIVALLAAQPTLAPKMKLPAPVATLSADQLVFQPDARGEPILKGLTFSIGLGEIVGIIGPSGAGKSTLARMLVGALEPTSGDVRIGGDALRNWQPDALGPFLGYVPQDVELFPGTVAQNISRMSSSPDAEQVVAAARLANCHELVQRLPQGYDTWLGPEGHVLSGGQRQRLALARAFFGNPKVVVLDEPNASLDSKGEQALIRALKEAGAAGMACVVIAQRTTVIPALTKLMVLRNGRIEAFGPKEEILHRQIKPAEQTLSGSAAQPTADPANTDAPAASMRFG